VSDAEAPPEQPPTSDHHMFTYTSPEGESDSIGLWFPANRGRSPGRTVSLAIHTTANLETAALWRAELAAGRLPQNRADEP